MTAARAPCVGDGGEAEAIADRRWRRGSLGDGLHGAARRRWSRGGGAQEQARSGGRATAEARAQGQWLYMGLELGRRRGGKRAAGAGIAAHARLAVRAKRAGGGDREGGAAAWECSG
ncbi:hypothetical protein E2562_031790 [Oryza meyeriana var. granulata]|uniref:DUF834 domain-containing protein n=1 Tax=Oryza meyeriana var. granulata TaxID=110450 RepID=A0A6G1EB06_9ORYZ|nr:hypothetical protein E2562_031790 [Oryza meyeriana var. granulata]